VGSPWLVPQECAQICQPRQGRPQELFRQRYRQGPLPSLHDKCTIHTCEWCQEQAVASTALGS